MKDLNISVLWVIDSPMTFFGREGRGGDMRRMRVKASTGKPAGARGISAETKLPQGTCEPCHYMPVLEGPEIRKKKKRESSKTTPCAAENLPFTVLSLHLKNSDTSFSPAASLRNQVPQSGRLFCIPSATFCQASVSL